jgi:serpin B
LLSNWRTQFEEENTFKQTFNGASGEKSVDMMHQKADFKTLQNDASLPYDAINLPYGEANADPAKNELSMSIFLPKEGESVATAYNQLFAQNGLKSAVAKLSQARAGEVELSMPKYVLESTTDTKDVMKQMGIQSAFDDRARFDDMMPIYIGFMRQKAFIDVNEKGTEAAAVDVAGGLEFCVSVTNQFTVDKPFISVIHDKQGRVLFVSTVHNIPEKSA